MINIERLKEEKKLVIRGFGTFFLKPSRKGQINGMGKGHTYNYKYSVSFTPSRVLKNKICK